MLDEWDEQRSVLSQMGVPIEFPRNQQLDATR
jgi:hypothetical protein